MYILVEMPIDIQQGIISFAFLSFLSCNLFPHFSVKTVN
jgi:hypothetical protein